MMNKNRTRLKILVVDDLEEYFGLLGDYFKDTPFKLIHAESISSARLLLSADIRAIILDLQVGEECGWDFLIELKRSKKTSQIPVIIITAAPLFEASAMAELLGAFGCLSKHSSAEEVVNALMKATESRG